MGLHQ